MTLLDPGDYSKTLSVIEFPPDVSLVSPNSNSSPGQVLNNLLFNNLYFECSNCTNYDIMTV